MVGGFPEGVWGEEVKQVMSYIFFDLADTESNFSQLENGHFMMDAKVEGRERNFEIGTGGMSSEFEGRGKIFWWCGERVMEFIMEDSIFV